MALILRVWINVIASNNSSSVPNPPGQDHESDRVLHEHHFSYEEISEIQQLVRINFGFCSSGNSMFSPTEVAPASVAPLLAASITPGPPPVMTEYPFSPSTRYRFARSIRVASRQRSSRTENCDGRRNFAEHLESFDEFRHDPKYPPCILAGEVINDVLFFDSISSS